MHSLIRIVHPIQLRESFHLIGQDRIVVLGGQIAVFALLELLAVVDHFVPFAEAEGGVGEEG